MVELAIREMREAQENDLREQLDLTSEWSMRDLPWMKQEFYHEMLDIIGENNWRFVSGSSRTMKGEETIYQRGTLFINEQGRANLKAYAEQVRT